MAEQKTKNHNCGFSASHGKSSCTTCPLKKESLLKDLNFKELEKLDDERSTRSIKAGDAIYVQGAQPAGIICLKKGKVKITKSISDGSELIVDLKRPVDFISVKSLMMGDRYTDSAIAIEDCEVCIITRSAFYEVVTQNPSFSMRLIQFFARKLDESENRILNLTKKHMRSRLAEALLLINDVFGIDGDGNLNVRLKRSELAALANMIPSNAIRVLSSFAKEELVATHRRKIKILDKKSLDELSTHGHILK